MKEYYFEEIKSTQDYAKELYFKEINNFVVFSDIQTGGRGRNGREWEAPIGGLWFSFDMGFNDFGNLFTIAIGVAIREVLEESYRASIKLKWPNDLILGNKKVGGILCEKINNTVLVGIGINTNVKCINEEKAITLFNETGMTVNNHELMNRIIKRCKEIMTFEKNIILQKFRNNMAYIGQKCFISIIKKEAKIIGLSNEGGLIIEDNGENKEIFAGEINICI